jgi:hypothetical protein
MPYVVGVLVREAVLVEVVAAEELKEEEEEEGVEGVECTGVVDVPLFSNFCAFPLFSPLDDLVMSLLLLGTRTTPISREVSEFKKL